MLTGFFADWPRAPTPAQHLAVLRGSHRAVLAVDEETGAAVGFVNLLSDGVLTAFVPWLEVLPGYRGRGIGTELMRRVLAGTEGLYSIDLMCDEPLLPYYARFGMVPLGGATLRHREALAPREEGKPT
ncbi:GNAT family N-acetyltransferase [Streptomyces hoynatensis]|uniref:GNAT family N-acetyltransferase n=2 Tax=Streptomyces hoynatensis TaxID=1141874 RepID=A0A3A9YLK7_9ACTN|nr:GNAT family N-acetyltransferase [Streptomyces hoynatensis]